MEQNRLVPKRRFVTMVDDWEERTLEKCAEIVRGASPRPIQNPKWFDRSSDIGWLRISDVTGQNGRINYLEQRLSIKGQEKTRVLNEPHLLLSIAATVGKPVINYVKTGVHDGFLIFLNPKFDREFMFQWLEMFRPKWQKYGQPGSQVNLNSDIVKNQVILLPIIEEQQKIGQFFKELDEMIATEQRKVAKIKALKAAYLDEMFPSEGERVPKKRFAGFAGEWEEYKLSTLTTYENGIGHEEGQSESGKYELINLNSISIDGGLKASGKFVDESSKLLRKNDLIMILSDVGHGDLLGRVALIPKNNKFVLNQRVALLRPNKLVNPLFLYSYINNSQRYFKLKGAGMSQLNISKDVVEDFETLIPNLIEQQKIGEFFKQLDDKISNAEHKLKKLKSMKQAYLQEMFV